jgi:hypothetical protein
MGSIMHLYNRNYNSYEAVPYYVMFTQTKQAQLRELQCDVTQFSAPFLSGHTLASLLRYSIKKNVIGFKI